jgi:rod shape-determining protein MreB
LPRSIELTDSDVYAAIAPILKLMVATIREIFEETPPELASDIVDRGIVISGGTGLLKNIDKYFSHNIGVAAFTAEEPLFCVIRGAGMAIENLNSYKEAIR